MDLPTILADLRSYSDPKRLSSMKHFGISTQNALGVSVKDIRAIAKRYPKDHVSALALWDTKIHEGRMLACLFDEPKKVTEAQMDGWIGECNSWDITDHCCSNLFDKTPFAYKKAMEWSMRTEEYVKRAGFSLMAVLAVHDKKAPDEKFIGFMPNIRAQSSDDRNFVKKAVNWALRQIGKRNPILNQVAIKLAEDLQKLESKSAKWIASDALRELNNEKIQARISKTKQVK